MKLKLKHIEVYEDTHKKVRIQAAVRHMTIRDYMEWLANKEERAMKTAAPSKS